MDPLVVVRRLGELLDLRLLDRRPVARAEVEVLGGGELLVIGAPNLGESPRDDVDGQRDWWA